MKINFIMHLQNYRNLRIVLFFILLLFGSILPNQLLGQKNDVPSRGKLKRETKKGHKSTDKSNAETVDVSEELRRLHRSNQTKSTRKRMKRNMKKATRHNDHKRDFFAIRWWRSTTKLFRKTFRKKK